MGELVIAGRAFHSRLLIGTAKYPNAQTMLAAIEASGAEIVTLSIRRINVQETASESIVKYLEEKICSSCQIPQDATRQKMPC